jgi:integrase
LTKGALPAGQNTGHKWWRFKYRFAYAPTANPATRKGARDFIDVSLKRAHEKRDAARQLLADGIDPSAQRKADEHAERIAQLRTFEAVAREWLKQQSWGDSHGARSTRRLEQHVFPWIGAAPIADVKRADMREVLRRIEHTGRIESAHRVLQLCSAIYEFAIARKSAIARHASGCRRLCRRDRPAITPQSPIRNRSASCFEQSKASQARTPSSARCAWLSYPSCVRASCGKRIGRSSTWMARILNGASRRREMKMREQHIVSLAKQAVAILRELHPLTCLA